MKDILPGGVKNTCLLHRQHVVSTVGVIKIRLSAHYSVAENNNGRAALGYLLPWQCNCVASYTTGITAS